MKHLLNNLSEEEKNSIREQHSGGMKINTDKFKKLLESELGNVKPFVNEQATSQPTQQQPQQGGITDVVPSKMDIKPKSLFHYPDCKTTIGKSDEPKTQTPYKVCTSRSDDGTYEVRVSNKDNNYFIANATGKTYEEVKANIEKELKNKISSDIVVGKDVPLPTNFF